MVARRRIITRPNYLISLVVTLFRRAPEPHESGRERREAQGEREGKGRGGAGQAGRSVETLTVVGPSGTELRVKPPYLSVFHPDDLTVGVARA